MPDYPSAIKKVRKENPDSAEIPMEPAGFMGRMFSGNSLATTNPFTGSVTYNPENMQNISQDELENTLTHELAHSRQVQATPYWQRPVNVIKSMIPGMDYSYYERPRELEAFQAERDRSARLGLDLPDPQTGARDIQLPPASRRQQIFAMFRNGRGQR